MKMKLLSAVMVMTLLISAFGIINVSAGTYGDLTYSVSNGEITITACKESTTGDFVIPAKINNCPVTEIGNSAFYNCKKITSVTIPDSITHIRKHAFNYCKGLTGVYISDLKKWCGIVFGNATSNPLAYANKLYLNGKLVTNLVIPEGTTIINDYAFRNCDGITSVSIPDSVTTIDDYAFSVCEGLENITIPDSVTTIGISVFSSCTGLTSVTIGKGVERIPEYAFNNCPNIKTVYYTGSKEDWGRILISSYDNDSIEEAEKIYIGDLTGCIIKELKIKDSESSILLEVPEDDFLTTVSFINKTESEDTIIVIAKYDNDGILTGMSFVYAENETDGMLTVEIDNKDGNIAKLKVFCLENFGSITPMGNSVSFPAEI